MSGGDNPPAFACASEDGHQAGMTLRDYFAGQVLAASGPAPFERSDDTYARRAVICRQRAVEIYQMADAMLAERSRS